MFTTAAGARSSVPHVAVLLTDGGSNNKQATLNAAFLAKQASITFIVVGIGSWVDQFELNNIASYPSSATVVQAVNVSTLTLYTQTILDLACNSKL